MKKIIILFSFCFILLSLFSLAAAKPIYSVKFTPDLGQQTINLNINENKTFVVQGFARDSETNLVSNAEISRIWCQFSMSMLEKVNSTKNSITLRAIAPGAAELKITVDIKGDQFIKVFTIEVKE